jgi:hypothetical protein
MNASHAPNISPSNPYPVARAPRRRPRTALLVLYAALVAQLAVWSSLAAHTGLTPFTQHVRGAEASLVVGGAIWLVMFMLVVASATIRYRRHDS